MKRLLALLLLLCGCSGPLSSTTAPSISPSPSPSPTPSTEEEILSSMSLEEKVGQLFFARCPSKDAVEEIASYHFGGYILFARDFEGQTKESMQQKTAAYQSASKLPLLLGVDEEGGTVTRVSRYKAFRAVPFHSPQSLYQEGGFALIRSDTEEKSLLLSSLGINVNFAPVCDIASSSQDYIYHRTFGAGADATSQYVSTVVEEMNAHCIGSVLKHFPGYGSSQDTHVGFAADSRPLEAFEKKDLLPFLAGIKAGAGSVLVSHNLVTCLDETYPASLSPAWHQFLRDNLNFDGVIITDDLEMDAIRQRYDLGEAAVLAVKAGNDMLLSTDYPQQYSAVLAAVISGEIPISQINASVLRILRWKASLGLLDSLFS